MMRGPAEYHEGRIEPQPQRLEARDPVDGLRVELRPRVENNAGAE